jgi:hypothetical protein
VKVKVKLKLKLKLKLNLTALHGYVLGVDVEWIKVFTHPHK